MRLTQIACWTLIAAGLALHGTPASAGGRFLDALRGEVDEPSAPASSDDSDEDGHDTPRSGRNGRSKEDCRDRDRRPTWSISFGSTSDDECDDSNEFAGWVFLFGITSPWWVPHTIVESEDSVLQGFPIAPYAEGHDGYLVFDTQGTEPTLIDTRTWGGRLSLDAGDNFHDVTTLTGRLRLDTDSRFGLDAEWVSLAERDAGGTDWLGRGDCNLVVRFAQSERVQFHSGIGLNWLADSDHADVGFNFTYGVDLFPVDPVVTSATLDLGKVGDASLIHFRGTVGVMVLPQLHLYTGYDLFNLEGNSIHSLLTGIEFWF